MKRPTRSARLLVEQLEDRLLLNNAPVLDAIGNKSP